MEHVISYDMKFSRHLNFAKIAIIFKCRENLLPRKLITIKTSGFSWDFCEDFF